MTRAQKSVGDSKRRTRRLGVPTAVGTVLLGAGIALAPLAAMAPAGASAAIPSGFSSTIARGSAWGAEATLNALGKPTASVGKVALQVTPCSPVSGRIYENHGGDVNLTLPGLPLPIPPLPVSALTTGAITNAGQPTFSATMADDLESSTVHSFSALDGLIHGVEVQARAHSTLDATGLNHHVDGDTYPGGTDGSSGFTFSALSVAGINIDPAVAPNTTITLPAGLGSVVVNEQVVFGPKTQTALGKVPSALQVTGVHIMVNDFVGFSGDMRIAVAVTRINSSAAKLEGYAFATSAKVSPLTTVGRQNFLPMACGGTKGVDKVAIQVLGSLPGIAVAGNATSIVNGTLDPQPLVHTTAQIENLDLLGGLVTADAITSKANSMGDDSGIHSDGIGSRFVNLSIGGNLLPSEVPPNTRIDLPGGLGYALVNSQVCVSDRVPKKSCDASTKGSITVDGIIVVITLPGNPLGLPAGATIRIAEAHAGMTL